MFFNFFERRARPKKLWDLIGCNFNSRASQVGLNTSIQKIIIRRKYKSIEEEAGVYNFDSIIRIVFHFSQVLLPS